MSNVVNMLLYITSYMLSTWVNHKAYGNNDNLTVSGTLHARNHLINLSESLNGFYFWKVQGLSFQTHYQPSLYDL